MLLINVNLCKTDPYKSVMNTADANVKQQMSAVDFNCSKAQNKCMCSMRPHMHKKDCRNIPKTQLTQNERPLV